MDEIQGFDAFDVGMHYLSLQKRKVSDILIGYYMRRFIQTFAPFGAEPKGFQVECERNETKE